jgi:uncharacterized protein (TIRG00374 family)
MASVSGRAGARKAPPWLLPLAGYAISVACLLWVYWGFDWKTELPRLASADGRLVAVAILADLLVYVTQGWRWSTLLRPVARSSLLRSTQAIYIGLFANEVLPFRTGELIRAYVQGKWCRIPFSVTLSSVAVERLLDGIWLVLGFFLVATFVELPGYLVRGSQILVLVLGLVAAALGIVMFRKHRAHAAVSRSRWSEMLRHVVEGLHAMGNARTFYAAAGISLLYLALQVVPIYALMRGYGLEASLGVAAVVLVILRLGTIIPQAPGNVGAFQFFVVLGLRLFGVDKATATGFATLLFVVVTLPLWLGGLIAVAIAGFKIRELQREARSELEPAAAGRPRGTGI